jgi:4-diphosphocytidyl-2-C-methyl-D-erythritol kinase
VAAFSVFAPAKVNLALHVLGRRDDGYHDLDSLVAFADIGDWLRFTPAERFTITAGGPFASALPEAPSNIITKAWQAVSAIAAGRGLALPPVAVHLEKNLPVSSGIGGGSSNAAAAMKGFLQLAGIASLDAEIMAAALAIGADVPVCLTGRACRMRGVGELITPLDAFTPYHALLVNPMVAVSTPQVFAALGLARRERFGAEIGDMHHPASWRNDLAAPAIQLAPVIGAVLARLQAAPGVTRAFMSGSGATCVALCAQRADPGSFALDPSWWRAPAILG